MTNEEQDQKPQRHGYSLVLSSPPCRGQPPCNPIRCYHGRDLLHPRLQDHVTTTPDHNPTFFRYMFRDLRVMNRSYIIDPRDS